MSGDGDQRGPALGEAPSRRVQACGDWGDLVLDADLRTRLEQLAPLYRSHAEAEAESGPAEGPLLVAVFGGSSGSGKTSAAQVLAAELGLVLVEVDAEALRGEEADAAREAGERALRGADRPGAMLVIDHADELLRHPERRPALELGSDAAPWPQVVVLCAEVTRNLEHAAGLPVDATLVFPDLDSRARGEVWRRHLPDDHAVPPGAMTYLAQAFRLSAAAIARSCATARRLAAADSEPVSLRHVARALHEAYRGRLTSDRTRIGLAEVRARAEAGSHSPADTAPAPSRARRPRLPRRRPSPEAGAPAGQAPPRRRRTPALWVAIATVSFLALVAVLVALTRTPSRHHGPARAAAQAAQAQVTVGPLWLSYPSTWQVRRQASVGGIALSPGITLTVPGGDRLVIGMTGPSGPGVPARLRSVSPAQAPQPVMLGAQLMYRLVAPGATGTTLYALPSLRATAIAACQPRRRGFAAACAKVLSTLTVTPGALLPTAVQTAYVRRMNAILRPLSATRSRLRPRLRAARGAAARRRISGTLAIAHVLAATALSRLNAGPATAANRRLAAALRRAGMAYAHLAVLPVPVPARTLIAAEGAITAANAVIAAAEAGLTSLGYPLP